MSEMVRPKFTFRDFLGYLLAYWFWILGAAISLLTLFMIREMINVMWPALGQQFPALGDRAMWTIRAIDRFALVFLGLVWLVYSIFAEQLFRMGISEVRLRRLKARVDPSPNPPPEPKSAVMRHLRKIGLDLLARRVAFGIGIPILILGLAYGLYQLAWVIMAL
jgi:hypothetical protein